MDVPELVLANVEIRPVDGRVAPNSVVGPRVHPGPVGHGVDEELAVLPGNHGRVAVRPLVGQLHLGREGALRVGDIRDVLSAAHVGCSLREKGGVRGVWYKRTIKRTTFATRLQPVWMCDWKCVCVCGWQCWAARLLCVVCFCVVCDV